MSTLTAVVDDLVAANRILAGLGVLDGFGHVSVRHPDRADCFLLARSLAPELVTRDDIMTFDMASAPQDGDTRTPYLERFIHGEIFVQRPDVSRVVHSHAATVVPFAASSVPLKPIYHMSCFLRTGAPVFEIREKFGMTDMLIRNNAARRGTRRKAGRQVGGADARPRLLHGRRQHSRRQCSAPTTRSSTPSLQQPRDRAGRPRDVPRRRGRHACTTKPTAA